MGFLNFFEEPNHHDKRKRGKKYQPDYASDSDEYLDGASSTAIIYRSEFDYISRCILDFPNIETGGQLFGFWTNTGVPVVMYVIGPGRWAEHNRTSFFQDQEYLRAVGGKLNYLFGLQHIGEWHSHHQMDLARPSGGDVSSMVYGVQKAGFPRMLLCIGNCTPTQTEINAFNFHVDNPREYVDASWDVIDIDSPFRAIADNALSETLIHPFTLRASHGHINRISTRRNGTGGLPEETPRVHWLTESVENVETMKRFVSMVREFCPGSQVKTLIDDDGEPIISINSGEYDIFLPFGFPKISPRLSSIHGNVDLRYEWNSQTSNLEDEFYHWMVSNLNSCGESGSTETDPDDAE